MTSPSLTVLHLVGSDDSRFYFECSFLYAKNVCRFDEETVKNYYALLLPDVGPLAGPGRVALLEDVIPSELAAEDLMNGSVENVTVVSVSAFLGLMGHDRHFRHPIQLVVPHMFDQAGMTTWRMLMEDVLHLPVVGMPGTSNVVGQDKVATRLALGQLRRPGGGPGVVPWGFAIRQGDGAMEDVATLMERVREEAGGFPVMIKSPLEDNSRGLHIVGKSHERKERELGPAATGEQLQKLEQELTADLREKLEDVFKYGDVALFEEFILGREFRCGVIEQAHGAGLERYCVGSSAADEATTDPPEKYLAPIPVMLEYVMTNPHMPIRTAADKLSKGEQGQMVMTKCTRRYVSCRPNKCTKPDAVTDNGQAVHPIEAALQEEIEDIVRQAHKTLGCGSYSLFDVRVDDTDPSRPRPYLLECCAFWSFTPVSAISLMLIASGLDWKRVALDLWREMALDEEAANARVLRGRQ